jgi:hypothetical protein
VSAASAAVTHSSAQASEISRGATRATIEDNHQDRLHVRDDYLAAQPAPARFALERVRVTILEALPGATEGISHQVDDDAQPGHAPDSLQRASPAFAGR